MTSNGHVVLTKIAAGYQDLLKDVDQDPMTAQTRSFVGGLEGNKRNSQGMHMPYKDVKGVETIGYGMTDPRIIAQYRTNGMDERTAQKMFHNRLMQSRDALNKIPAFAKLNPNQQAALISFHYNVGDGNFNSSTLRKRLITGDLKAIPGEMRRWQYTRDYNKTYNQQTPGAKQDKSGRWYVPRVVQGLANRRTAEVDMFNKPYNPTTGSQR